MDLIKSFTCYKNFKYITGGGFVEGMRIASPLSCQSVKLRLSYDGKKMEWLSWFDEFFKWFISYFANIINKLRPKYYPKVLAKMV